MVTEVDRYRVGLVPVDVRTLGPLEACLVGSANLNLLECLGGIV